MSSIQVLLVDDQQIVRQGLATILKYTPEIEVVGEASDGEEAIALARDLEPDVVLMDVKMPRLGGIPATRQICSELPDTQVIILTTYDTDDLVFEGIKAGAKGYLLKDATGETLVGAIRGVVRGESQLDPGIARKVLGEFRRLAEEQAPGDKEPADHADVDVVIEPLTPREEEVLQLLVEGLSNKEIGARLHLTEGTIKNYVSAIITKLQANDRTHAVVTALRQGLVEL
ncbi:MAG TPA: response regulator transcription factor [Anaerolineae bacterium]|nr:response regulator transcription factor [Anaerolineae bacterium]